jgi:hypothetical protein
LFPVQKVKEAPFDKDYAELEKDQLKTAQGTDKPMNEDIDNDAEIKNPLDHIDGDRIEPDDDKRERPFLISFYVYYPVKERQHYKRDARGE